MKRPKLAVVLYVLLVFLSGALVGVVGQRFYAAQAVRAARVDDPRRQYAEEMRTRLQLSPAQVEQLAGILQATRDSFRALRKKWSPELRAIQDTQVQEIRSMLTDPQKLEYEKMRQEREQRQNERMHQQHPPQGGTKDR